MRAYDVGEASRDCCQSSASEITPNIEYAMSTRTYDVRQTSQTIAVAVSDISDNIEYVVMYENL